MNKKDYFSAIKLTEDPITMPFIVEEDSEGQNTRKLWAGHLFALITLALKIKKMFMLKNAFAVLRRP